MPIQNAADVVRLFADQHVVIVGDIVLDEYVTGDCSRMSPEAPVAIVRVERTRAVLGGAGNTAANVAALGGRATLIGLGGEDATGDDVRRLAAQGGVRLELIADGRPTTRKTRVIGQQQQLLRLDHESSRPADPATEARLLERVSAALADARVLVISDYAKGVVTQSLAAGLVAGAHRRGIEVVTDPRPSHREFYDGVDALTPNWKEALALLGWPESPASDGSITAVGEALARRYQANIVLTLGPRGIAFFGRDFDQFAVPTLAREVFDVSGAGDTVVAVLALARAAGADYRAAVSLANAAAGIVVGKLGTATVSVAELLHGLAPTARLVTRDELPGLATRLRRDGKRIVTLNGSFDVAHAGHLHILEEARRQGDVLIVGLNSDRSVRAYKGESRPINGEHDRARLLLALRVVDFVHIFDETVPMPFIEAVRPDVHVNGAEYGEQCIEAETVRRVGGRVHIVPRVAGLSTTAMVEKLAASNDQGR